MDGRTREAVMAGASATVHAEAEEPAGCTRGRFVYWLGWQLPPRGACERLEANGFRWRIAANAADVSRIAAQSVLCFAPHASSDLVKRTLDAVAGSDCAVIVHGAREQLAAFGELLAGDRLFYLAAGVLEERELAAIVEAAARQYEERRELDDAAHEITADVLRRIALAQSVVELSNAVKAAIVRTVSAERGRCLLFDRERQVLWPASREDDDGESIAAGLSSFVLRTGEAVMVGCAVADPRFDRELDHPDGRDSDRFLAVPVRARKGDVLAVLIATRPKEERSFDARDAAALETLAAHVAPYLVAWLPANDVPTDSPFRAQALRELASPSVAGVEPLRLDPAWMKRVTLLGIATLLLALVAAIFVRVPEYASANAIVRDGMLIATFDAKHAHDIERGMSLRYRDASMTVERVEATATRVVVTARVRSNLERTNGRAEVRLRSERLLFVLFPKLKGASRV